MVNNEAPANAVTNCAKMRQLVLFPLNSGATNVYYSSDPDLYRRFWQRRGAALYARAGYLPHLFCPSNDGHCGFEVSGHGPLGIGCLAGAEKRVRLPAWTASPPLRWASNCFPSTAKASVLWLFFAVQQDLSAPHIPFLLIKDGHILSSSK